MNNSANVAARVAGLPSYFIVFVAAMVATGPFAIDTYLPAMPSMASALGVDIVAVNATLSSYLLGFAAGQLLGGPISDQTGRRNVGLLGLMVFCGSSLAIAWADTVSQVLWLRVAQALGGGFATVICMPMVPHHYTPYQLFRCGRSIQFTAILSLTVAVSFFTAPLWLFTAMLSLVIGPAGMKNPSVQGLYLFHFDRLSGSATSLMSVAVFSFGSLLGLASGFVYDGTLRPIVYTMLAGLVAANLIALKLPRPQQVKAN